MVKLRAKNFSVFAVVVYQVDNSCLLCVCLSPPKEGYGQLKRDTTAASASGPLTMKLKDYHQVCSKLRGRLVDQPDFEAVLECHPSVSYDTLVSIHSQECVVRVKQAYGLHRRQDMVEEYCRRWRSGESVVEISESLDFPACSLGRLMLPALLGSGIQSKLTKVFNNPDCLLKEEPFSSSSNNNNNWSGRTTGTETETETKMEFGGGETGVDLPRLIQDLKACVARDHISSPLVANVKRAMGLEYEVLLYRLLSSSGLAYESETELRMKGATKTPDALLKIPFMLGDQVVHWIDSKACFCSEDLYYNDGIRQFRQYVNRFGPGMVIYWFGYIEDIPFEESILISDSFPKQITRLEYAADDVK